MRFIGQFHQSQALIILAQLHLFLQTAFAVSQILQCQVMCIQALLRTASTSLKREAATLELREDSFASTNARTAREQAIFC